MSRTKAMFTEADIRRALRAAAKEDVQVSVEIFPDGRIRLIPHIEIIGDTMELKDGVVL